MEYVTQPEKTSAKGKVPTALSMFLTFWYAVVIVPVSLAVLVGFWAVALALTLSLVATWLQRSVFADQWQQFDWLAQQSDLVVYSIAAGLTLVGIMLVWLMVKATGRFFKLHQTLLKQIWG